MSNAFDLQMVLSRLIGSAPFLAVAFCGIVLCMVRQSRPARVRIAVGCALALQLASYLVLPFLYNHVFQLLQSRAPTGGIDTGMIVVNLFTAMVSATALGLLLFAAFASDDRPPEASQT
jgi:D-alanyl-lipoteichoic acid acyltransferase DltB (MBOAT superfamily)